MALILLVASIFAVRALSIPAPGPCTCASTLLDDAYPIQWQFPIANSIAGEPVFVTSVPNEFRWLKWLNTSDQQSLILHPLKLSMDNDSLMIWIPDHDIATGINDKLRAKKVGYRHVIDCDTIPRLPVLTFGFENGVALEQVPEAYIIRVGGSCFSPFYVEEEASIQDIATTGLIDPIFERFFDKDIIALQSQVPSTLHDQDFTELIPDKPEEFEITIQKVLFGGETISDQPIQVSVFSGAVSTDMYMPHRLARLLNRRIGATDPKPGHLLSEIDCRSIHTFPNLAFTYTRDGKEVSVEMSPVDYLIRVGSVCLSPFAELDENVRYRSDWIMGDVFIRRYRV